MLKKQQKIKIRINNGTILATIKNFYSTKCKFCGEDIYLVKIGGKTRMPISRSSTGEENEYVFHNSVCEKIPASKRKK